MASLLHLAVGAAAARVHERLAPERSPHLAVLVLGYCALSCLPDADVVAFSLGVPYGATWGHRGAAHSLSIAVVLGLLVGGVSRCVGGRFVLPALTSAAVVASHGVLDAFTDGGHGVALLWPWSDERFFAPWRPIPVAPIGVDFLSGRGALVLLAEAVPSLPVVAWALWPRRAP